MTTSDLPLLLDFSGPIARLTLNRPERRNPLGLEMIEALLAAFDQIGKSNSTRVVILSANGPVFCAGHDLTQLQARDSAEYHHLFMRCSQMMLAIRQLPQPVIAQVQGMATAAGCQLVATCDLVVASTNAQFAAPGVKIGVFCTTPMVPLVRAIPAKIAMEMLLTAEPISAERAREIGLINRVVPPEDLATSTTQLAERIAAASPHVITLGKRAFYRQLPMDEVTAYSDAIEVITDNVVHCDAQEGIAAFLQKRTPQWKTKE